MLLDADDSQLVLVDYQSKLMPFIHDSELVLRNAMRLARVASLLDVPAWGTEENAGGLGENPPGLKALCVRTFAKTQFSAVAEGFVEWLRPPQRQAKAGNARSLPKHLQKPAAEGPPGRNGVVIAGCEAHVCLLQTSLDLLDEDFEVWVVTDACGSRTERNRDAAFDRLASAGAELVTTEMVVFEWLRGCEHPHFREALEIVK